MRYEIREIGYEVWDRVRTWSANMRADHFLVFGRTIAGRKRGRRFKAAGANETRRVRAGCFVRGLSCARRLGFGAKAGLCERAGIWTAFNKLQQSRILVSQTTTIVASSLLCSDAGFGSEKLASGRGKRHFMREACSDARFGGGKLASGRGKRNILLEPCSDAGFWGEKLASGREKQIGRAHV